MQAEWRDLPQGPAGLAKARLELRATNVCIETRKSLWLKGLNGKQSHAGPETSACFLQTVADGALF